MTVTAPSRWKYRHRRLFYPHKVKLNATELNYVGKYFQAMVGELPENIIHARVEEILCWFCCGGIVGSFFFEPVARSDISTTERHVKVRLKPKINSDPSAKSIATSEVLFYREILLWSAMKNRSYTKKPSLTIYTLKAKRTIPALKLETVSKVFEFFARGNNMKIWHKIYQKPPYGPPYVCKYQIAFSWYNYLLQQILLLLLQFWQAYVSICLIRFLLNAYKTLWLLWVVKFLFFSYAATNFFATFDFLTYSKRCCAFI